MAETTLGQQIERSYWLHGTAQQFATALTGIITVLVALKTAAHTPSDTELMLWQAQILRACAFASLTIWATLTMGLSRRGVAAMLVMVFATVLELIVLPARGGTLVTLAPSACGIALAYLGLHFYVRQVLRTPAIRA